MSTYLIKGNLQFRCDTPEEAKQLIEEAKKDKWSTLLKYSNEVKTQKAKGEIIDEWQRVILTKEFTSEKDPMEQIYIHYSYEPQEDEDE